jgi:hypothetical protein
MFNVQRILWPGNSPDLNMIEPAWFFLKRVTTKERPLKTQKDAVEAWTTTWANLEQERIQAWIECIEPHIKEIIRLESGNHYHEGRQRRQEKRQQLAVRSGEATRSGGAA